MFLSRGQAPPQEKYIKIAMVTVTRSGVKISAGSDDCCSILLFWLVLLLCSIFK